MKEIKYLGIKIGGRGRNIFGQEKKRWLQKAKELAAQLISNIKKVMIK